VTLTTAAIAPHTGARAAARTADAARPAVGVGMVSSVQPFPSVMKLHARPVFFEPAVETGVSVVLSGTGVCAVLRGNGLVGGAACLRTRG
jgi:hypothetical protein